MTRDIPVIARMIVIKDIICEKEKEEEKASFYNYELDSECEYCMNTTAWD
jgi:hypothetical protein